MEINYPLEKCYFCDKDLWKSITRQYPSVNYCSDLGCYGKYHYGASKHKENWTVSFLLEDKYHFRITHSDVVQETSLIEYATQSDTSGGDSIIFTGSVSDVRQITLDNYPLEIDRIRKLQIFK